MLKSNNLQPYPSYKPSGIEWLGNVPSHWKVRRLKQVAWNQGGFAFRTDPFGNEGIAIIRMNKLQRGVLNLENVVRIPVHQCTEAFELNEGDIVYGLSGSIGVTGSLGNYVIVKNSYIPAQLNLRVARILPAKDWLVEKFLVESLQTRVF